MVSAINSAKKWVFKTKPDPEKVQRLEAELKIHSVLCSLLVQRGICTYDEAKHFFRPTLADLHDPFSMADMGKAIDRLNYALTHTERIVVYGDYDVDGTTSVALVYSFLSAMSPFVSFYIPDRHIEGYGVSYAGIDHASALGATLIIALDCGIKSIEHVKYAKSLGIDFIICDHHKPGTKLPDAIACLDPKREDCTYPFKELSGCGVGFKLMQALSIYKNTSLDHLYTYLDLVAISIAADIVPVCGENRTLLYFGLEQINKSPRPGIQALIEVAGFKNKISVTQLVFGLGPRINAAGRIKHAHASVDLMLAPDLGIAKTSASEINTHNNLRKDLDMGIYKEALELIAQNGGELKSTVLFKKDWHKGVIGIVASRCIEKYYKPTILLTESNEKATGSARSVAGFDLHDALCECADLLEQFGGHTYAAGLTLKLENVSAFKEKFEQVVANRISDDMLMPRIEIDTELELEVVTPKFFSIVQQMAPFGPQHMPPTFLSRDVEITCLPKLLKDEHLKLQIKQHKSALFDAIGFGLGHLYTDICKATRIDICYTLEENDFNGKKTIQLNIKDIQFNT